ncbi:19558_t:CDS:1, partial [Racocetra persica]
GVVGIKIKIDEHQASGYYQRLAKPSNTNSAVKNNVDIGCIDFDKVNRSNEIKIKSSPAVSYDGYSNKKMLTKQITSPNDIDMK